MVVLCRLWPSDHLMHVSSWLLDFGCALVAASVFVVLLFHDLTTAESRMKVWCLLNVFKAPGGLGYCPFF